METKKAERLIPLPLFDSLEYIHEESSYFYLESNYSLNDIQMAKSFLKAYVGSKGTFNGSVAKKYNFGYSKFLSKQLR